MAILTGERQLARITQDQRMGVKVYLLVLNVALLLAGE